MPSQLFAPLANDDFSLGEATIDDFCHEQAIVFAHDYDLQLAALQSMTLDVDIGDMPRVWLSMLAAPGFMLQKNGSEESWWVLQVCTHGVLAWRLLPLPHPERDDLWVWATHDMEGGVWNYLHIHQHAEWLSMPLKGIPPVSSAGPHGKRTLALTSGGADPMPLLECVAAHAFVGWTAPLLKQLIRELKLLGKKEPMPSTKKDLVRFLVARVLRDLGEEAIDAIMDERFEEKSKTHIRDFNY